MATSQSIRMEQNLIRGLFPRGFFSSCALEALPFKVSSNSTTTQKTRLIIISNKEIEASKDKSPDINNKKVKTRKRKPKRSKPRKWVTHKDTFIHDDSEYKINVTARSGVFTLMMRPIIDQLDICLINWKRVFVYRFDLRQKDNYIENNAHVTKFFKNLNRRLQRAYKTKNVGYVWAREHERSKSQHYHCAIYLDGDVIRRPSNNLKGAIRGAWCALHESHHVWFPEKAGYFIDNEETKAKAIYRLSYLAKERGKGYRGRDVKDYSTSRLCTVNKTKEPQSDHAKAG